MGSPTAISSRVGLRSVLVLAIAGPLTAAVVLTAVLMLQESRARVTDLAVELDREIAMSVEERLRDTLAVPHEVNRSNAAAILAQILPTDAPEILEPHFFRQLQTFPTTSYVQLGRADGWFVGVERTAEGFAAETTEPDDSGKGVYPLDFRGQRQGPRTSLVDGYDARSRPWFRAAVASGEPTWSPIYQFSSRDHVRLGITAVEPVSEFGELVGVVGTDITLHHLSTLLDSPRLKEDGRVFVMEADGTLVASSQLQHPFTVEDGTAKRLKAVEAQDRWTRVAASTLDGPIIEDAGERAIVHRTSLTDDRGLDWTIVVVTPEARYLAALGDQTRYAAGLSLLVLLFGVALATDMARRIGGPIGGLAAAAEGVAGGSWDDDIPGGRTREVARLARAFTAMRDQLQSKEAALKQTLRTRTAALHAAEKADRAKSAFLANMSHELRTPLNAILGYAEMVEEELNDPHLSKDLESIVASGHHLLGLIDQVLELSRLEAAGFVADFAPVNVSELIDEVLVLTRPIVEEKHRFAVESHAAPTQLTTDAKRARQILVHLLENASKFTTPGDIRLVVKRDGAGVAMQVHDTGGGIDPEELERIFHAFTQADEAATRTHGGTGLGLAISRKTAECMGGSLTAQSQLGEGSIFTLWLPIMPPAPGDVPSS
ncbi:MAG: sensor histidine kinase [Proteobacteria bacterium]|nr:sensor histidine kinase [Pseudomonadota bacterium]